MIQLILAFHYCSRNKNAYHSPSPMAMIYDFPQPDNNAVISPVSACVSDFHRLL